MKFAVFSLFFIAYLCGGVLGIFDNLFDFLQSNSLPSTWLDAFVSAFAMIIISELGDKTFFLAVVFSMRAKKQDKLKVFFGCCTALALMSLLSVLLGGFIFTWVPMLYTRIASAVLFLIFSLLMVKEAIALSPSTPPTSTLESITPSFSQNGCSTTSIFSASSTKDNGDAPEENFPPLFLLSKSFVLTFMAEWGDRSQLATIALATSKVSR